MLGRPLPADFKVPEPTDIAALMPDEVPLDAMEQEPASRQELADAQGDLELEAGEDEEDGAGQ